jgi:hypothetical protein
MKRFLAFFFSAILAKAALGQSELPGIRNTGLLPCIQVITDEKNLPPGRLFLQEKISKVQLYPGFAVVYQTYLVRNEDSGAISLKLGLPLAGSAREAEIGQLFFNEPYAIRLCVDGQRMKAYSNHTSSHLLQLQIQGQTAENSRWYTWNVQFEQGKTSAVTVQAIVRTSLSRYIREGESRDGNAFALRLDDDLFWKRDSTQQVVMVHFLEGLKLTDIWGIKPDGLVEGDFANLLLKTSGNDLPSPNFLIWYRGAPPDFKFDQKILPYPDTLYSIMEQFPTASFKNAGFAKLDRNNFSLSPSGLTFSGVLYFLMFTVPWIVLAGFIIFLLREKKINT